MNPISNIVIYNPAGAPYISDGGIGTTFPLSDSSERTAKIMGEEVEFAQIKAEIQAEREFLAKPENYFGPMENQW